VTRRPAPRPAAGAFRTALDRAAPQTGLAAAQSVWAEAVGERVAAAAEPVSERNGELVVACADAIWAEELDLMQGSLLDALRARLGEVAPRTMRFRVRDA
jgi:predicted nucleic acid-binding Zn ribbon protein